MNSLFANPELFQESTGNRVQHTGIAGELPCGIVEMAGILQEIGEIPC